MGIRRVAHDCLASYLENGHQFVVIFVVMWLHEIVAWDSFLLNPTKRTAYLHYYYV